MLRFDHVSADTNILGHLFRSGYPNLISNVCNLVIIDEWILDEVGRRLPDIKPQIEAVVDSGGWMVKITKSDLVREKRISVYNAQMDSMRYLFLPKDEGEKRAIALAKAKGSWILLTDDENFAEGPYYAIDRGIIPDMEALAFWDLLLLNILTDHFPSHAQAKEVFDQIAREGYDPPYLGSFGSKIKNAIRRLLEKQWFQAWCTENPEINEKMKALVRDIKQFDW